MKSQKNRPQPNISARGLFRKTIVTFAGKFVFVTKLHAQLNYLKFNFNIFKFLFDKKKEFGAVQVIRLHSWLTRNFNSPAPNIVKWQVLKTWGGSGIWIETGTYLGETTRFLSAIGEKIYTIEPSIDLYENAKSILGKYGNIEIIAGTSEEKFLDLLQSVGQKNSKDISFWLDGHYSAGITFLGQTLTPILFELDCISRTISKFKDISIFIDDVRLFSKNTDSNKIDSKNSYPSLSSLVEFANAHKLNWTIEHDIFIMSNRG